MEAWHDEVNDYEFGRPDQDFYYSVLITHYTQVSSFHSHTALVYLLFNKRYCSEWLDLADVGNQSFDEKKLLAETELHLIHLNVLK